MIVNLLLLIVFLAVTLVLSLEDCGVGFVMLLQHHRSRRRSPPRGMSRSPPSPTHGCPPTPTSSTSSACGGCLPCPPRVAVDHRLRIDHEGEVSPPGRTRRRATGGGHHRLGDGLLRRCQPPHRPRAADARAADAGKPDVLRSAPDRKWLGSMRDAMKDRPCRPPEAHRVDKDGDFILRYADRRLKFEAAGRGLAGECELIELPSAIPSARPTLTTTRPSTTGTGSAPFPDTVR